MYCANIVKVFCAFTGSVGVNLAYVFQEMAGIDFIAHDWVRLSQCWEILQ